MNAKWNRNLILLLVINIFTTQILCFPVMAAKAPGGETIEAGMRGEAEPETTVEPEFPTGTLVTPMAGKEAAAAYSYEDQDASLSGISFTVTDVRDSSKSKILDTDDGKQAVYLFGGIVSCGNTRATLAALSKCIGYYEKDKLNVFAFDFRGGTSEQIASWLSTAGISEDIIVGTAEYGSEAWDFYGKCFLETVAGTFGMPLIVYKGTDGAIYTYTTSVQSESDISRNIEAGGLEKAAGNNAEGLLYVRSGADYSMAYEILDLVNTERQKEGLAPLDMDNELLGAAMQRAVECEIYFSHTRPNGQECFSASAKMNGENIAYGYTGAGAVMNGWMNSQGHRANILNSSFRSVGIGISDAGGRLAFVQCFGTDEADAAQKPSNAALKTYEVKYKKEYVKPAPRQASVSIGVDEAYVPVIKAGNIEDGDAIGRDSYTWASSNENVAAVDSSGTVRGIGPGNAEITGTNVLNHEDTLAFSVSVAGEGGLPGEVQPGDIPDGGIIPEGIWAAGIKDAVYTGKAITHDIRVYDGTTLLAEKKDYTVSYKNNVKAAGKTDAKAPSVIISGRGNYSEKKTIPFNIHPKNIEDSDVTADDITLAYTGGKKKANPVILYGKKKLVRNRDFIVKDPAGYSEAKEYSIRVEGKGNYTGTRDIRLTITDKTPISKASASRIPNQVYDGKSKTPKVTVKLGKMLEPNKDYTVSYENNREIGTASVVIRGAGEYAGMKRIYFQIVSPDKNGKYDIGEDRERAVTVDVAGRESFMKGGSTPAVRVSFHGKRLTRGKDYAVSFKNNKASYAVSGRDAAVVITGKGDYCGKISRNFRIDTKDISKAILVVSDKIYTGKAKGHVPKIVLADVNGKRMKAGTDYEKTVDYAYAAGTRLENGESRKAGDVVKDTDIVPAGTTVKVTVRGIGNYDKTITGEYRVIAKEKDIHKAKVVLKNPQYYTGKPVEPDKGQFEVTLAGRTLGVSDYSIVCYLNNTKKGKASVVIRGEGEYGGIKTAKFTIGSKAIGAMKVN